MANKVTAQQIEQLYIFTRRHFVEYYDLQTELVDHLANAIETRWHYYPQLTFDDALKLEFKKFGIYGFSDVVEQRQAALAKRYRILIWGYFKDFFKLPQVLLTLTGFLATYKILEYEKLLFLLAAFALVIVIIVKTIGYKKQYDKRLKETGKRWFLEETIYRCGGIAGMVSLPFQFFNILTDDNSSPLLLWSLSGILVIAILLSYIVLFIIPERAEEHLAAVYAEYKLEKL